MTTATAVIGEAIYPSILALIVVASSAEIAEVIASTHLDLPCYLPWNLY
jgi:hypothetical protein